MYRNGNTIFISSLRYPPDVMNFLRELYAGIQKARYSEIVLDMSGTEVVFPNVCVPFVSFINYYRSQGVEFEIKNLSPLLKITHFDNPLQADKLTLEGSSNTLSRVWRFSDAEGVSALTNFYVRALAENIECSNGVLEAFEYCINEVMDNVLQHSGETEGFIMVQIHAQTHKAAICLADTGIGIFETLSSSTYKPKNAVDAITMALKEGVTRTREHQGNGLWGLFQIVNENSGRLEITSGSGRVSFVGGDIQTHDNLLFLDKKHQGTVVDFQIDTNSVIDISKALGGHQPINLRFEASEMDTGEHYLLVKEQSHGTGTRKAAIQLRNVILNMINEGASKIVIDFLGISIISSSFADELVGKLVIRFGFFGFQQVISLRNMSETVQVILHRSVAQRMMESLQNKTSAIVEVDIEGG